MAQRPVRNRKVAGATPRGGSPQSVAVFAMTLTAAHYGAILQSLERERTVLRAIDTKLGPAVRQLLVRGKKAPPWYDQVGEHVTDMAGEIDVAIRSFGALRKHADAIGSALAQPARNLKTSRSKKTQKPRSKKRRRR